MSILNQLLPVITGMDTEGRIEFLGVFGANSCTSAKFLCDPSLAEDITGEKKASQEAEEITGQISFDAKIKNLSKILK